MTLRLLTPADANAYWHLRLEALRTDPSAFGQTVEDVPPEDWEKGTGLTMKTRL